MILSCGASLVGRTSQAECREFDSRTPLQISSSYFLRYLRGGAAGNPIADIRLLAIIGRSRPIAAIREISIIKYCVPKTGVQYLPFLYNHPGNKIILLVLLRNNMIVSLSPEKMIGRDTTFIAQGGMSLEALPV